MNSILKSPVRPRSFPPRYYERNRREWALADVIVVNSEWSREAIIAEGANPAKIEILPLAFEAAQSAQGKAERERQIVEIGNKEVESGKQKIESKMNFRFQISAFQLFPPLRVLFLGQVNVRKGIHYLIKAARLLERKKIHFDVVGPIGILPAAVTSAPRNMTFHGPASRDRAARNGMGRRICLFCRHYRDGFCHHPIGSDGAWLAGHHHALLWRSRQRWCGWIHCSATRLRMLWLGCFSVISPSRNYCGTIKPLPSPNRSSSPWTGWRPISSA